MCISSTINKISHTKLGLRTTRSTPSINPVAGPTWGGYTIIKTNTFIFIGRLITMLFVYLSHKHISEMSPTNDPRTNTSTCLTPVSSLPIWGGYYSFISIKWPLVRGILNHPTRGSRISKSISSTQTSFPPQPEMVVEASSQYDHSS